jgi:hypothetical protein
MLLDTCTTTVPSPTTVMSPSNTSATGSETAPTNPAVAAAEAAKQQPEKQDANNSSSSMSKMGRKGDPRMHRSVAARLENPDMALLDALRQGGFLFPVDACGHDSTLVDADNVTLGQRKNQLSRRLRLARQQESGGSSYGSSTSKQWQSSAVRSGMVASVFVNGPPTVNNTVDLSKQHLQPAAPARKRARTSFTDPATGQQIDDDVDMGDDVPNMDRMAKFHPNFHPVRALFF